MLLILIVSFIRVRLYSSVAIPPAFFHRR